MKEVKKITTYTCDRCRREIVIEGEHSEIEAGRQGWVIGHKMFCFCPRCADLFGKFLNREAIEGEPVGKNNKPSRQHVT